MGELACLRDCEDGDFDGELGEDANGPYLLDDD